MPSVIIPRDFGATKKKISHWFHFFPLSLPWSDRTGYHNLRSLNVILSQLFHSALSPSSGGLLVLLFFCHQSGIMCIAQVVDIFPSNLDSSYWFIFPSLFNPTWRVPLSISCVACLLATNYLIKNKKSVVILLLLSIFLFVFQKYMMYP